MLFHKQILFFLIFLSGQWATAQYLGGTNHGFSHASGCTDLNGNSQTFSAGTIIGNSSACFFGSERYSVSLSSGTASMYYWTVPSGTNIISGQGTSSVSLSFGLISGDISVTITSPCHQETVILAVNLNSCPLYYGNTGDGYTSGSTCMDLNGSGATFSLGTISGPATFCAYSSQVYEMNLTSGTATWFDWSVPPDAVIVDGVGTDSVTVFFGEADGNIRVEVSDGCYHASADPVALTNECKIFSGGHNDGYSFSSNCSDLNGLPSSLTEVSIAGPGNFCVYGSETFTASVTGTATEFFWVVPDGATIISGNGSNSILVNFGQYGGNIIVEAYSGCEIQVDTLAVSPGICPMFSGGSNDGYTASSTCTNLNGVSEAFVLNSISGPASYCQNNTETYSITLASGSATYFYWSVPSGANIETGQGSSSILLSPGTSEGNLTCEVSNACYTTTSDPLYLTSINCGHNAGGDNDGFVLSYGCGDLNGIIVPLTLNPVSGPISFCPYSTETYSINPATGGASRYYWYVPDGSSVISGQGSNTVSILFGLTGGNIVVEASDLCNNTCTESLAVTPGGCYMYAGGDGDGYSDETTCGDLNGNYTPITLNPISGPSEFCPFTSETYSISFSAGFAAFYYWNVPTGSLVISGQGSNNPVILFGSEPGNITADVYNDCELVTSALYPVTVGGCPFYSGGQNDGSAHASVCSDLNGNGVSLALPAISGPTLTCINTTENYSISTTSGYGQYYYWSVPSDAYIITGQGLNSITVQFGTSPGDISVVVSNSCESVISAPLSISFVSCPMFYGGVNDGYSSLSECTDLNGISTVFGISAINGLSSVCINSEAYYSVSLTSGYADQYFWEVPSGSTIVSGQNSNTALIRFGSISGNVSVTVLNPCNTITNTLAVSLMDCPQFLGGINDGYAAISNCTDLNGAAASFSLNPISGSGVFCANTSQDYSISLASGAATSYDWVGPPGSVVTAGQGTDYVTILFGETSGYINCVVSFNCETMSATPFAVTNNCLIYNGGNNDGFSNSSGCGTLSGGYVALTLNPISGPSHFCSQSSETYTITLSSGFATTYIWSVPSGSSILSGQGTNAVLVLFGTSGGNISVTASNGCESVVSSGYAVSPASCPMYAGGNYDGFSANAGCTSLSGSENLLTVSDIQGSAIVCPNGSESFIISITSGNYSSITWLPPSGAIVLYGQGTLKAIIVFGETAGEISVEVRNSCISLVKSMTVTTAGCTMYKGGNNDGYDYAKACANLNGGGSSFTISDINGPAYFCPYGTDYYSVTSSGYVSNYYWTIPSGSSILTGQGSSLITVQFGSVAGNINVSATNNCSTITPAPLPVSPMTCQMYKGGTFDGFTASYACNNLNGSGTSLSLNPITGSVTFCKNATETYSVSLTSGFASTYYWTVPTGSNIIQGQNTTTIMVQFGTTNGNIAVSASNGCQTENSAPLAVTQDVCRMYKGGLFSGYYSSLSGSNIPLPIELIDFSGYPSDTIIILSWTTASEMNSDFFELQKYSESDEFVPIAIKPAAGMSNNRIVYSAYDTIPHKGYNYYRLRNVDMDGNYSYSKVIAVYVFLKSSSIRPVISIFPNPVKQDQIAMVYAEGFNPGDRLEIAVSNIMGTVLWRSNYFSGSKGNIEYPVMFRLLPGVYLVSVSSGTRRVGKMMIISDQ